ncbi:hypothetical protein HDR63_00115 [bacterium]|nr:hypothetical protein [bacterium]
MNLRYITCSDMREDVSLRDAIALLSLSPRVELGIQAHAEAMDFGTARYDWLDALLTQSARMARPLNIAIHVNYDWCSQMVAAGAQKYKWPGPIQNLFHRTGRNGAPLIRRWQLNIGDGTPGIRWPDLVGVCRAFADRELIFPYNTQNPVTQKINRLHQVPGCAFSLLYDASYGAGISPDAWYAPAFADRPMGYAGGLSPDNVADNLEKIRAVCPADYTTWIDAEGQLMTPHTRRFDIHRATRYVLAALDWERHQHAHPGR